MFNVTYLSFAAEKEEHINLFMEHLKPTEQTTF